MSTETENKGLLPSGLHDLLPPNAALEDRTIRALIDTFSSFGYDHVKPPLVEFESTLTASEENGGGTLSGAGRTGRADRDGEEGGGGGGREGGEGGGGGGGGEGGGGRA